jgi:surfeit locus 1 family protein
MRALAPLSVDRSDITALETMEWREALATGVYDPAHQIVLRNRYFEGESGYHLITPLMLSHGGAILVDRGWIPAARNASSTDWRRYDEIGVLSVAGQLRSAALKPAFGGVADPAAGPGAKRTEAWNNLDIDRIAGQIPYPILRVYLQAAPDELQGDPPFPVQPELDLSEGPHMGYSLQWFAFAGVLLIGYPFYVRSQLVSIVG